MSGKMLHSVLNMPPLLWHESEADRVQRYDYYKRASVTISSYGVCDNIEQLLVKCPELESSSSRKFVITLTKISKADQPIGGR